MGANCRIAVAELGVEVVVCVAQLPAGKPEDIIDCSVSARCLMRVVFDQGTPVPLRIRLVKHTVATVYELGWSELKNGDLLE